MISLLPFSYADETECSELDEHNPTILLTSKTNYQIGDTIEVYGCTIDTIKGVNFSLYPSSYENFKNILPGGATGNLPVFDGDWHEFSYSWVTDDFDEGVYVIEVDVNGIISDTEIVLDDSNEIVPDWIKNTAKWWVDEIISDDEYLNAIEFLVNENIIEVSSTNIQSNGDKEIPSWILTHAKYWTEGQMSDSEYLDGIKHLINNGIISLTTTIDSIISITLNDNDSTFTVTISDSAANTDSELAEIVNLTITDDGPIQAGTTIVQNVIASETGIDSGTFIFIGIISDFITTSDKIHAIYETNSETYESVSELKHNSVSVSFETLHHGSFGEMFEGSWTGALISKADLWYLYELEQAGVFFDIDDASKTPLAVFDGMYSSGGHSVTITDVFLEKNTVKVNVLREIPGPECVVTEAFEHPYHIVDANYDWVYYHNYDFTFTEKINSCE